MLQPRHFQLLSSERGRIDGEETIKIIMFSPEIAVRGIDEKHLFYLNSLTVPVCCMDDDSILEPTKFELNIQTSGGRESD